MAKTAVIILACAVILAGCGGGADVASDGLPIASWDGAVLTAEEYIYFLWSARMETEWQMLMSGTYDEDTIGDFWNSSEDGGPTPEQSIRRSALESALHYASLYKLAADAGTQPDAEGAQTVADEIDAAVAGLDPDPKTAQQEFLREYGMTPDAMKDIYNRLDIIDTYLFEISTQAVFSDEEVTAAYNAQPQLFEAVTARHILISTDERDEDEALTLAEEILESIRAGADIGELAALHSDDPGSKNNNGEYTFGRGEMVEPFEQWAFSANVGDTGIVQTTYGFHIMQLMHRPSPDELKDEIRGYLGSQAAHARVSEAKEMAGTVWEINESAAAKVPLR
ncbi:MAG: peptidylprolyl isomerase [Oscillospiraceae bacterium]|nr:peptidylprolyl isomerase [Oscillospiraceae bacterium]